MHRTRTLLVALLAMLITAAAMFAPRLMAADPGFDAEPNDSCATARDLGAISLPFSGDGILDGKPYPAPGESPNIDFFKFTATPGSYVQIELGGALLSSGLLIGVFDSRCQLQASGNGWSEQPAQVAYKVPVNGQVRLGVTSCCDNTFTNGGDANGEYTLSVREAGVIGSVSGQLIDAASKDPLTPASVTSVSLSLQRLSGEVWISVAYTNSIDDTGRFNLSRLNASSVLQEGTYRAIAIVNGYKAYTTDSFTLGRGESRSLGSLALTRLQLIAGIGGRVVDSKTHQPISGAWVAVSNCDALACYNSDNLNTDADGRFSARVSEGYQLYEGSYTINIYTDRYEGYLGSPFIVGPGEFSERGEIALTPIPLIGSVSGRLVDTMTGKPLSGTSEPHAQVSLDYCDSLYGCYSIAYTWPDADGNFTFTPNSTTRPLSGTYALSYWATQYIPGRTEKFSVGAGEHHNAGNVTIDPVPVRIENIVGCDNIAPEGGICRYSADLISNVAQRTNFQVWSAVRSYTPGGYTSSSFQPQESKLVLLRYGQSRKVSFSFNVPRNVPADTIICVDIFVARDQRGYYFSSLNQSYSPFCVYKDASGPFRLMTEEQSREFQQRLQASSAARSNIQPAAQPRK